MFPARRRLRRAAWPRLYSLLAAGLFTLLGACGSDSTTDVDLGPTGNPTVNFSDPPSGGSEAACREIGDDADFRVPLLAETTELLLRPPGACGYYQQCGRLRLYVQGVFNNESAVPAVELLMRKLADRYHDGSIHAGTGQPDVLHLRIEVVDDDGLAMADHYGHPLVDEATLRTVVSCD